MTNKAHGQPVGFQLQGWTPRERPPRSPLEGRYCRLEPLDCRRHASDLFEALRDTSLWTYLPCGPFEEEPVFRDFLERHLLGDDPLVYAIVENGRAVGVASYLRIDPAAGSIEVGGIVYSPRLKRSRAGTEAMYLLMRRAFDELGYRRYEWKCDSLNAASRRTAERLGFQFEGIFRQATVYKGRNRDTAWYSIIDSEWPMLKRAFLQWLEPSNFDEQGCQSKRLIECFNMENSCNKVN